MECKDVNCPKHGTLATRGMVLEGDVVSDKMQGTVVVQREYYVKDNKYQRFRRFKSRIPAHNSPCINAREGDKVKVMECRKLSKTVNFVVIEKLPDKRTQANGKGIKAEEVKSSEEKKAKRKVKSKNG